MDGKCNGLHGTLAKENTSLHLVRVDTGTRDVERIGLSIQMERGRIDTWKVEAYHIRLVALDRRVGNETHIIHIEGRGPFGRRKRHRTDRGIAQCVKFMTIRVVRGVRDDGFVSFCNDNGVIGF